MSVLRLDVPFLDASASQLVWRLGAPPQPALATAEAAFAAGLSLELRLLGASHQVLVRDRHDDVRCSELVACSTGRSGELPAITTRVIGGLEYEFTSAVRRVGDRELAATAAQCTDATLAGAFPGSPHAVTAIQVTGDGWRTWHVYPQAGEVVTTTTRIAIA